MRSLRFSCTCVQGGTILAGDPLTKTHLQVVQWQIHTIVVLDTRATQRCLRQSTLNLLLLARQTLTDRHPALNDMVTVSLACGGTLRIAVPFMSVSLERLMSRRISFVTLA